MLNYWWVTRPKRKLDSIPEVLATFADISLNQEWEGQRTTQMALEEALEDFAGCALVVSHDRWFLDRICTHILAFENNSEVKWFEGNWSEYAEWRKKMFGEEADRPHKTVYRKMTR